MNSTMRRMRARGVALFWRAIGARTEGQREDVLDLLAALRRRERVRYRCPDCGGREHDGGVCGG